VGTSFNQQAHDCFVANIGDSLIEEHQHLAPGPLPIHRARNRSVRALGQPDVSSRITQIRLTYSGSPGWGRI
jgi:hypothetical protein